LLFGAFVERSEAFSAQRWEIRLGPPFDVIGEQRRVFRQQKNNVHRRGS
jgi:hypothetical protein